MSVRDFAHRTYFTDVSRSLILAAADVPTTVGLAIIPDKAGHTVYIQRISVAVSTAAAQTIAFQDRAGTPKLVAMLPASALVGDEHLLLDAPEGVPLTEGKGLDLVGLAGVAGILIITGFRKATGVQTAAAYAAS